ncbi:3-hydroxybutyrate dehydrogenase [Granulosicoccus antarcticus]|uniref:D-beta-hydroxybutyrate dehydrogenase n=1 Tax=Granulosicoccus antarcticus IMCC3135 TaxID=1192854 RepID=A0A2Z2NM22_9GAMM|nr:3-hydroxybutyrate dehydrogenase [Granulosicoccus antarcticus]ASJ71031.1 D-beta-hydroxybutyrate dehydrogenase [Granulosicoccus antarcticus IMCC3135]
MSDLKTALVTGSTSGIGLGIAEALAAKGMNLVLNGLESADEIEPLRTRLEALSGGKVIYSSANLMDPAAIRELMQTAADTFGGVDILVNNAGMQFVSPVEDFPDDKWEAIMSLNLSAAFYTCKAAVPFMKQKQWGRIINIASAHALVASPFKSAYVAAKHGLLGLTKTLALEVAEQGVTVNAICPGYVWTPLVEKQIPDTAKARGMTEEEVIKDVLLAAQPNKQFTTIEQVTALALFLCSDDAQSMTGGAVSIDGGWTAH